MMRTRIKICGIRDGQTARAAVAAGVDGIGLVFVEGSPRQVSIQLAQQIVATLPPFVEPVGLFVDAPLDEVRQIAKLLGLRTVQLHGQEPPHFATDLAPLRVIKAVPFDARHISAALAPWRATVSNLAGILFDAGPQFDGNKSLPAGGTGRRFDWEALARLEHGGVLAGLPQTILAGGLDPNNVAEAIAQVGPYAVDVSSGVESSRGVKDPDRIEAFVEAVRKAGNS